MHFDKCDAVISIHIVPNNVLCIKAWTDYIIIVGFIFLISILSSYKLCCWRIRYFSGVVGTIISVAILSGGCYNYTLDAIGSLSYSDHTDLAVSNQRDVVYLTSSVISLLLNWDFFFTINDQVSIRWLMVVTEATTDRAVNRRSSQTSSCCLNVLQV